MRFGIKTPPQHNTFEDMLAVWKVADDSGVFESAWNFDHFYPLVGDTHGPCMEAWVTLAALARETRRLRIGCMVNGSPYRHPAVFANMAASLDIVSGGRLELGIGAGWNEEESNAYGIDLLPLKQRMDRFDEYVAVVDSLLRNEVTNFNGEYFTITDARCEPKGPQSPRPPIVIGGGGEKRTMRTAAKFADHWNLPFATPDVFSQKKAILMQHCDDLGRDATEITCSVQIALGVDESGSEAADKAAALGNAGCDKVIFTMRGKYNASQIEEVATSLEQLVP